MLIYLLLLSTLFLAYVNGANDNFKGVATLYGSGTCSYKTAITIGAIFLAQGLISSFSGKGLVSDVTPPRDKSPVFRSFSTKLPQVLSFRLPTIGGILRNPSADLKIPPVVGMTGTKKN